MNGKTRTDREERLRAVLRQGDPAGAEPGPAPEEVRRMRRAILSAAAETVEPRRRGSWLPVVASAAAAALTVAIALGLWRAQTASTLPPAETGRQAVAVPVPDRPAPAPARTPAPEIEPLRAEAPPHPRPRRTVTAAPRPAPPSLEPARLASAPEVRLDVPDVPGSEPDSPLPLEEPPLRQVQLEAPGGTRVFWMLSAESVVEDLAD